MTEEHNVFDEMLDFETKMYHFLDPPRSPEIVPSPEGRREALDASYAMYAAPSASSYFRADPTHIVYAAAAANNGGDAQMKQQPSKWFCTQCNRSFAAQFALDQHRRFKHQGYKIHCRYCPHTSTNGYALFLHVQREHSDVDGNGGYALNGLKSNTKKAINARRKRRAVKHAARQSSASSAISVSETDAAAAIALSRSTPHAFRTTPPSTVINFAATADERRSNGTGVVGKTQPTATGGRRKRTAMKIVRQAGMPTLDCDKCGKKFAFHSGLRMHTKMVHSGFRFTCQYCGLHFTNGYAIHRHVNIVHNVIGAVRNSGFSAATPEHDVDDMNVIKSAIVDESVGGNKIDVDATNNNQDATENHIRLRLRRKALPTKAVSSSLEWSMDNDNASSSSCLQQRQTPAAESVDQFMRRFSAPASSSSATSADVKPAERLLSSCPTTFIRCLLCPFKAVDLETLKLHSFKHNSPSCSSSSATSANLRCPYCNYSTDQTSSYVVHASMHFSKPSTSTRVVGRTKIESYTSHNFRCTYCDRIFYSNVELNDHERKHSAKMF